MNVSERDLQTVGDDHRERRGMALTVSGGTVPDRRGAVVVYRDRAILRASATRSDLHIGTDADTERDPVAAVSALGLIASQLVVAGDAQRLGERGVVVATVVLGAHDRFVRELVGLQEVAATHFGGIDTELDRPDGGDPCGAPRA